MRRRLLEFIFNLTSRHPVFCLVLSGALTVLSISLISQLDMETNLAGQLDKDEN